MLMKKTLPLMGHLTFVWKKELTTFQIQLKGSQGAAFMGGLG